MASNVSATNNMHRSKCRNFHRVHSLEKVSSTFGFHPTKKRAITGKGRYKKLVGKNFLTRFSRYFMPQFSRFPEIFTSKIDIYSTISRPLLTPTVPRALSLSTVPVQSVAKIFRRRVSGFSRQSIFRPNRYWGVLKKL